MNVRLAVLISCLGAVLITSCTTSKYAPAENHLQQKEYNEAVRSYLRLLAPHARDGKKFIYYDAEAVCGIGVVYWEMEKYETAEKILQMVTSKDPVFGKGLFYLGMALEGQGKDDEALRIYRKFAQVTSSDPYRQMMMGRMDYLARMKITREVQYAIQNEVTIDPGILPEKSVAVLYFQNLSEDKQWEPLQKGLAEMMITDLSQIDELKVVERLRINAVMEELRLEASGIADEANFPKAGKLFGVQNIIKGSYMVSPNLRMNLDSEMFHPFGVSNTEPASLEGNLSSLFQMEKEMVLKILESFGIQLTIRQRESILKIPTENMKAFLLYCQGLEALDHFRFEEAQTQFRRALTLDRNFKLAQDWLMPPKVWEFTHNRNLRRVGYEVASTMSRMSRGKPLVYTPPPAMLSTANRLKAMGMRQQAAFLPGSDSRKSYWEADARGAALFPRMLAQPPAPPE